MLNADGKVTVSFTSSLYSSSDIEPQLTVNVVSAVDGEVVYSERFAPTASEVVYTFVADVAGEFHVLFTTKGNTLSVLSTVSP